MNIERPAVLFMSIRRVPRVAGGKGKTLGLLPRAQPAPGGARVVRFSMIIRGYLLTSSTCSLPASTSMVVSLTALPRTILRR